jgi:hypothetical protein
MALGKGDCRVDVVVSERHLEKRISQVKSTPCVWFATGQPIAEYVNQQHGKQALK